MKSVSQRKGGRSSSLTKNLLSEIPQRKAISQRKTSEVEVSVSLNVDGRGKSKVNTGAQFLNHVLGMLAKHALFDLNIEAAGDLKHHICEDVALALGETLSKALAEKRGIKRFGFAYVPMGDSLARAVVDIGGRPYVNLQLRFASKEIEDLTTEDIEHFFHSLAMASRVDLHLAILYGENDHHKAEAATKALGLALREAVGYEARTLNEIPSTKGAL